jgi:hypothetical protein
MPGVGNSLPQTTGSDSPCPSLEIESRSAVLTKDEPEMQVTKRSKPGAQLRYGVQLLSWCAD